MTTSPIVSLKTRTAEVQDSVVSILEEVLAKAKRGEIAEVCIATINADGSPGGYANQTENRARRIGAAAQLFYDVLSSRGHP